MSETELNNTEMAIELVRRNELDEALKMIGRINHTNELDDEIILMQSHLSELKTFERTSVIDLDKLLLEKNKLRLSILRLIREIEKSHNIQSKSDFLEDAEEQLAGIITIKGKWINRENKNIIFFQQKGNRIVGLYDFAFKKKTGVYLGKIEGDLFDYRWEWFSRDLLGFGQLIITPNYMEGTYWFGYNKNEIEPIQFTYLGPEMPAWLTLEDFDIIWNNFKSH